MIRNCYTGRGGAGVGIEAGIGMKLGVGAKV